MNTKKVSKLVFTLLASSLLGVLAFPEAARSIELNFSQTDFTDGGTLSGFLQGEDDNNDNIFTHDELDFWSFEWTGNDRVTAFSGSIDDLGTTQLNELAFDLDAWNFLNFDWDISLDNGEAWNLSGRYEPGSEMETTIACQNLSCSQLISELVFLPGDTISSRWVYWGPNTTTSSSEFELTDRREAQCAIVIGLRACGPLTPNPPDEPQTVPEPNAIAACILAGGLGLLKLRRSG